VHAGAEGDRHRLVVGGMELDDVEPVPEPVVAPQRRSVHVGQPASSCISALPTVRPSTEACPATQPAPSRSTASRRAASQA
jgi:hypothetical protein